MTEDRNREERYVVTDRERIRRLAEREGAEPAVVERGDGADGLRIRPTPDDPDADRIAWDEFFDRFEGANRAVQYRPAESGSDPSAVLEVVDRSTRTAPVADDDVGSSPHEVGSDPIAGDEAAREDRSRRTGRDEPPSADEATENPADVETEPLATGDTGDAEPVAFERTGEAADRDGGDEAAVAPTSDVERGTPGAENLVLDEIHDNQTGSSGVSDEYLVESSTAAVEGGRAQSQVSPGSGQVLRSAR